ncbi:hypothetical protein [Georgenia sp. Z1491]|uniref:hypothetical protein n=1 Tax=Georgenia sp. Z1491 TaxID=3416707 RepID=UPI003CF92FC0
MRTNRLTATLSASTLALALVLAGCSSSTDDGSGAEDQTGSADTGTGDDAGTDDSGEAGGQDDSGETGSEGADGQDDSGESGSASSGEAGSDGAELPGVAELAAAVNAALEVAPEGDVVMVERDDTGYEVDVVDGSTLIDVTLRADHSIVEQESDDVDDDTVAELETAELTIIDAITAAAEEGAISDDPMVEEIELDTEDGTVYWEFDHDEDDEVDVYVDAVTGEVRVG